MEYFQGKEILNILIIFCLVQHDSRGVSGMTCLPSLQSLQKVDQCPRNALEWDARADMFNCSSINQTCVPSDMFLYHCVLNADGTELLEVCAPLRYIHGQKCTEFDSGGPIIQESANTCGNATVPCPQVYNSREAFKCQGTFPHDVPQAENEIVVETYENPIDTASKALILQRRICHFKYHLERVCATMWRRKQECKECVPYENSFTKVACTSSPSPVGRRAREENSKGLPSCNSIELSESIRCYHLPIPCIFRGNM